MNHLGTDMKRWKPLSPAPPRHTLAEPATGGAPPSAASLMPLSSDDVLRGQKCVAITHNGSRKRLQATRQGKFTLNK